MRTIENRPCYNCDRLRYPSDLTNEEWSLIAPLDKGHGCNEDEKAFKNKMKKIAKPKEKSAK